MDALTVELVHVDSVVLLVDGVGVVVGPWQQWWWWCEVGEVKRGGIACCKERDKGWRWAAGRRDGWEGGRWMGGLGGRREGRQDG